MVKKIVLTASLLALLPLHAVHAQRGNYQNNDQELYEMEDMLDRESNQILGRASRGNEGEEFIAGVIGIIGEIAARKGNGHGGGGWHPGFGRQHRMVKCVAQNRRGERFQADGYVQQRVAQRALQACRQLTRHPQLKRTCQVVRCREAGRGGGRGRW